jgi:hypothetical protein
MVLKVCNHVESFRFIVKELWVRNKLLGRMIQHAYINLLQSMFCIVVTCCSSESASASVVRTKEEP